MIKKVILLEGVNDKTFIEWLIIKAGLSIPNDVVIGQVGGKPCFDRYIRNTILGFMNDTRNNIDYTDAEITQLLLIKDFDSDDKINEFDELITYLSSKNIHLHKYYISGSNNPPRLLESLFIENNGEFLKSYVKLIKKFNVDRRDGSKEFFQKLNDKLIFHSYQKLQNTKIAYKCSVFDKMFDDNFIDLPNIKALIDRLKSFIEE